MFGAPFLLLQQVLNQQRKERQEAYYYNEEEEQEEASRHQKEQQHKQDDTKTIIDLDGKPLHVKDNNRVKVYQDPMGNVVVSMKDCEK